MLHTRNSPYNKVFNQHLVIRSLFQDSYSRAELSRLTGLTRATMTHIVDELIEEGLVRENGIDMKTNVVGRNPKKLEIVSDCYYILCIDIARNSCSAGLVDFGGNVMISENIEIEDVASPSEAVEKICNKIKNDILTDAAYTKKLLGLGITTPGPVDTINGIIDDIPDFGLWRNFRIVDEFKKHFNLEIKLERDANAVSLAELYFGFGRKFNDFICLMSYVGIGFGMIKNRQLFSGNLGLTPEFGHISIDLNGKECVCGNRGCLYQYYGLQNILNRVRNDFPDITGWEEIVDRAYKGEKYFVNIVEHYAEVLSIAVVNAINFTALDKIILSGFIMYRPDLFLNTLRNNVEKSYIAKNFFKVDIVVTQMKSDENLIGAATSIIEHCFNKYK